ncbi:acylphosphatase [Vibrio cholerae]|uniref:Acylphosphatase n=2 Tax=Vibrionaceae TaxID=641 RepID=A0A7Z7YHS7_VIBCL|nr:Acylphosphate phosphohydrolase, putative [Vibrio cholerae]EEO06563.1 acylphosphate phosphohydrolase [Vibrio cholerae TM 11079-80]ORP08643.1 acylphosphatase [Vibrio paracholerae]EGQ8578668.1 acylphosphatase [Vibrio cholerae]EGQ8590240.1 acylphosphatase [Vibrio cholerae]
MKKMEKQCSKFIVSGHVQGVGFRYHTSHQGLKLGLTGYAKNLNNGDVEVVACGAPERLEELYLWLQEGPKTASVRQVRRLSSDTDYDYPGFEIL